MTKRRLFLILLAVGVLAASTMTILSCGRTKPAGNAMMMVPEVAFVTVQPEKFVLTRELPGRTSSYLVAEIRPQVNGIIQERNFKEGSEVRAGEILYRIDPAPYQAAFEQAKAALELAEANIPAVQSRAERLRGLAVIKAVGQQDSDDASGALARAEANVASAKAAMESARINLSYTPIKAPISGRIGVSSVTVGALVSAYQPVPLAVIQQIDPIYVDVTQASADLLRLRRSLELGKISHNGESRREVKLFLEDGTPYPQAGKLQFRDVTVDPTTGSYTVRMVFPNPEGILLPGMYVRAQIQEGVDEHAILVPQQGISRDTRGDPYALVVGNGETVEMRVLVVDRTVGDRWLVSRGLNPGDRVIVEGLQKIRPGATVKAVPYNPLTAAGSAPAAQSR